MMMWHRYYGLISYLRLMLCKLGLSVNTDGSIGCTVYVQ